MELVMDGVAFGGLVSVPVVVLAEVVGLPEHATSPATVLFACWALHVIAGRKLDNYRFAFSSLSLAEEA